MKTSTDKVVLPSEIFYSSYVFASGKPLLAKLRLKTDKEGFEKVKPPFLLLVNHSSKDNIKIAAAVMFPQKFNFIVNPEDVSSNSVITGYMGVIPLKRNVFDDETIGKIQKVVAANGSVALFAEQKVSVDGTPTYINPSVAKLIKTLRIPVCVLTINGSYLNRPSFSQKTIGCSGATAVLSNLFTSDEIKYMSEEEVLHAAQDPHLPRGEGPGRGRPHRRSRSDFLRRIRVSERTQNHSLQQKHRGRSRKHSFPLSEMSERIHSENG